MLWPRCGFKHESKSFRVSRPSSRIETNDPVLGAEIETDLSICRKSKSSRNQEKDIADYGIAQRVADFVELAPKDTANPQALIEFLNPDHSFQETGGFWQDPKVCRRFEDRRVFTGESESRMAFSKHPVPNRFSLVMEGAEGLSLA